jgi:hypothetical protein
LSSRARRPRLPAAALLAVALAIAAPALAGPFDVIMMERPVFVLCGGCGLRLAGADFALIVNTGTGDIPDEALFDATFEVRSSAPQIEMAIFPNTFRGPVGPVRPREAVGLVVPINQVMLQMIEPGETFRNAGTVFLLDIYAHENYDGPVTFEVAMTIGDHRYYNTILSDVRAGSVADMTIHAAGRGSAVPIDTPVRGTTWGAIKKTYR